MSAAPTYRDQAELAAQVFQRLVAGLPTPADAAGERRVLECRDIVVGSLVDRLAALGLPPGRFDAKPSNNAALASRPRELAERVAQIVVALPRLPEDGRRAPSDVLEGRSEDPTVNLWRDAARYVASTTATLTESGARPWETDDGAAWWLMRDLASLTEAMVVVDDDLDQLGLLSSLATSPHAMPRDLQRMTAAQCVRVVGWYATNDAAESAGRRDRGWDLGQPQPVRRPADLAPAQRLLAGYIRPLHSSNSHADPNAPVIALSTVRAVVTMQQTQLRAAIEWAGQLPDLDAVRVALSESRDLVDQFAARLPATRERVTELPARHTVYQAKELLDATRRLHVQGRLEGLAPVSVDDLSRWAQAMHETNVSLGLAVRRELRRSESNFAYRAADHDGPVPQRPPLDAAADALVKATPPPPGPARWVGPAQREALAATLAHTPPPGRHRSPVFPRRPSDLER